MERIELNIPSKFAHSRFIFGVKDENGKVKFGKMKLNPTDIDYFYSIVYLYRLELLGSNRNCLLKISEENDTETEIVNRYIVNESEIDFEEEMSIDYYGILSMIHGEHNSNYVAIRDFVRRFKDVYVETNLFGKDKNEKTKMIKVFDYIEDNASYGVDMIFSKEYILPYLVTEKYFKKVTLNILYFLTSQFAKRLYLLLKDYVGVSLTTDTKTITKFLGESYNHTKIKCYIRMLNQMDIKIKPDIPKFRKKTAKKFTITHQKWFIDDMEEYKYHQNRHIWKRCEDISEEHIADGVVVKDFDGYTKGVFKNLSKHERNNFEGEFYINRLLEVYKKKLSKSVDKTKKNPVLVFKMKDIEGEDSNDKYIIRDDYELVEYPFPKPVESSPSSTKKFFDEHFDPKMDKCVVVRYLEKNTNHKRSAL
jgi:hypothetical protein